MLRSLRVLLILAVVFAFAKSTFAQPVKITFPLPWRSDRLIADAMNLQMPLNGEVTCNFEQAESKRGFNLTPEQVSFPNDADNGWWFDTDVLISGGDQTTAKLYLKYKNKDGDFVPVDGHGMRISIGEIVLGEGGGNVSAENYSRYIYFVDSNGNPLKDGEIAVPFVEVTTSTTKQDDPKEQGYVTVYLKGGPLIYQANTIKLKVTDLTQIRQ